MMNSKVTIKVGNSEKEETAFGVLYKIIWLMVNKHKI